MEHPEILDNILVLLFYSVISVAAFRTFNLPPILGYLLVGATLGSHALHWIPNNETVSLMGEVGVVFLLFAIGLEFSFKQLMSMKSIVLGLGSLQVLLFTAIGGMVLYFYGASLEGAIIAGGALAMSSTAIVIKQLTEQGELRARHGRLAFGILLFQDLAVVPFLVAIPILAGSGGHGAEEANLLLHLLKGMAIFTVMLLFGRYALRPLFHFVGRKNSVELFSLTVLLIALMAAWVTNYLGLSLALGAFIAGMMLSETEYRHQIDTEIRPFRDILMGIFFITVGTQLNLKLLPDIWLEVLLLTLGLVVGKTLIIAALSRLFSDNNTSSLRSGLVLAQGGEFGFALLTLAMSSNLLPEPRTQAVLTSIIISMVIAPIIIRYNGLIAKLLFMGSYFNNRIQTAADFSEAMHDTEDHVILCGYQRIGQNLARFLREQGIRYVALELDPKIIKQTWEAGEPIFYGDASHPEILAAAGIKRARMVVITVNNVTVVHKIIEAIRAQDKRIEVIVPTRDDSQMEELERAGASDVIPETLEATMMVAQRVLENLGIDSGEAMHTIDKVRLDRYNTLRSYFHGDQPSNSEAPSIDAPRLTTMVVREGDYALGKEINELELLRFKAKIISLRRGRIRGDLPPGDTVLQKEDALVIQGSEDSFEKLADFLQNGPLDAEEKTNLAVNG